MRKMVGAIPVLLTPMHQDDSVDIHGLVKLLNFLMSKKIGGFWALGTGSEDMNLSFQKRVQVARTISEVVNGRVPVALGCGFFALEDTFNFIEETQALTHDSYHVMPYHPLLSTKLLEKYYENIADKSPKPLWLYTSGNWSQELPLESLKRLKNHKNIAGIKFSNRVTTELADVLALADDHFQVITAVAKQAVTCFQMGSQGHTSSIASVVPEALQDIYELCLEGKWAEAKGKQKEFNQFLESLPKTIKKDNFLGAAEEKYILSLMGICQPYTTSYYRDLNEEEKKVTHKAMLEFKYFERLGLGLK